jgi:hypothetical protein
MSITGFKVGHYYRWIGPMDYCESWNKKMESWKDGNARKCTQSHMDGKFAAFDNINGDCWGYGHCLQHFEEVASSAVETSKELTEPGTIGRSFTISIIPQTLVEKRRATRRRLLGL